MAFKDETKLAIKEYLGAHLADWNWHKDRFDFITDSVLRDRLADEFISTRYVYKILEGMSADSWLLRAQIRLQVLSYASIYEAVIHHILFDNLPSNPDVQLLTEFSMKKVISIPAAKMAVLQSSLEHDGKEIIPTYEGIGKTDTTKVRFDRKAECAEKLGLIEGWLKDEIIELYEARNSIHIHAEIRKSLNYQLDLSKRAYLRMEPFVEQIKKNLPTVLANHA
ncbi:hypothetical protein [Pseudomonas sp. 8O]|uniref:hypothetical protein n=1 Tax=Pseudomonas sp. 8O TaxID=2653165 RepID=UPI0012EF661A|nr:hypothetical protein [Pseudomonas sp. 8O]VXB75647.1 conserved hypothetical protein [Pseudomonas sp. 8O]